MLKSVRVCPSKFLRIDIFDSTCSKRSEHLFKISDSEIDLLNMGCPKGSDSNRGYERARKQDFIIQ